MDKGFVRVVVIPAWLSSLLVLTMAQTTRAQAPAGDSRIWNGVYTAEQAARGKVAFDANCAVCHDPDLSGDRGPALKGNPFMKNWELETLNRLFLKIKDSMPPRGPDGVAESAKVDIVSYILQANTFPPGNAELRLDATALDSIRIVKKDAPGLPNFTLVGIVGCLERADSGWVLTNASTPVVVESEAATPQALKESEGTPLGAERVLLQSITAFAPERLQHQKVEARGLLYRAPGESRLDLLSLLTVAPRCAN